MDNEYRQKIAAEFESCIERTISRLSGEDSHRPFHSALLSDTALFWSRFERSFSTSFGQGTIERISKDAALAGGASEASKVDTIVNLYDAQYAAIDAHISRIRSGKLGRAPHWDTDLAELKALNTGAKHESRVISDLCWKKNGVNHYLSIKTVKPNIDQTAEAKRDLLKLKLNDPTCEVYFGLYYNPYGEKRSDYLWSPPKGVFDFQNDRVVLIGRDYWDVVGGPGFYDEIIKIAQEVGLRTRVKLDNLSA